MYCKQILPINKNGGNLLNPSPPTPPFQYLLLEIHRLLFDVSPFLEAENRRAGTGVFRGFI